MKCVFQTLFHCSVPTLHWTNFVPDEFGGNLICICTIYFGCIFLNVTLLTAIMTANNLEKLVGNCQTFLLCNPQLRRHWGDIQS